MTTPFGLLPNGQLPDPGLEHATDHKERAIGVLLSQLRDKPRFTTLIAILVKPLQELEDVFWDLYTKRRIDTATGAQLDILGRIVDEDRGGLLDDDYRAIIRIKVRVLFSRGTGPDLIRIAKLFLESSDFAYQEFYPAAIEFTVFAATSALRLATLRRFLRKAKSGGVRLDLVDGTGGLGTRFHYGTEGTGVGYGVGTYGGVI
jgi:Protein of unknown function (DUF2612)